MEGMKLIYEQKKKKTMAEYRYMYGQDLTMGWEIWDFVSNKSQFGTLSARPPRTTPGTLVVVEEVTLRHLVFVHVKCVPA